MSNFDERVARKYITLLSSHVNKVYDKNDFVPLPLLTDMVFVSSNTGFETACVLNKKAEVIDVYIGDSSSIKISTPIYEKSQNGLRIIHTHPSGNSKLSAMDKSLLLNNHLDAICAISIKNATAYDAEVGFINDNNVDTYFVSNAMYINKSGLMQKIADYNKLFNENVDKMSTHKEDTRAVLALVAFDKKVDIKYSLEELEALAATQGIITVGKVYQNRTTPHPAHLIGEGKIEELQSIIQLQNANLVIFDNELSSSKQIKLEELLGVKVIDRFSLILDIFASRAKSKEAITQIELAQLKYRLPRLRGVSNSVGRFGGGVGQRGPGETPLELSRRNIEKEIIKKEQELDKVKRQRQISRTARRNSKVKNVAIVGYTNSGKSTLLNTITKASVYAKDELFATLSTTSRSLYIDNATQIVLTDTVGFISNLPHEFISAFSSTLEETIDADLLIHVVDISNKDYRHQEEVVVDLLNKLNATKNIITVYNKIDKVPNAILPTGKDIVCISAKNNVGIDKLKNLIKQKL